MLTLAGTKTIVQTILISTRPSWKKILDNSINQTIKIICDPWQMKMH